MFLKRAIVMLLADAKALFLGQDPAVFNEQGWPGAWLSRCGGGAHTLAPILHVGLQRLTPSSVLFCQAL